MHFSSCSVLFGSCLRWMIVFGKSIGHLALHLKGVEWCCISFFLNYLFILYYMIFLECGKHLWPKYFGSFVRFAHWLKLKFLVNLLSGWQCVRDISFTWLRLGSMWFQLFSFVVVVETHTNLTWLRMDRLQHSVW